MSLVNEIKEKIHGLEADPRRERLDGKMIPVGTLRAFATDATDVFWFVLFLKRSSTRNCRLDMQDRMREENVQYSRSFKSIVQGHGRSSKPSKTVRSHANHVWRKSGKFPYTSIHPGS